MSAPKSVRESSYALDATRSRVRRHNWAIPSVSYLAGDVITAHGIVAVYSQNHDEVHSRYDFAWRGRHYMRTEERSRTVRGLAIEAAKFARRIALASSRTGGQRT